MDKGGVMTPPNVLIISLSTVDIIFLVKKKIILEKKKAMLIVYGNISGSPVVCHVLVWW